VRIAKCVEWEASHGFDSNGCSARSENYENFKADPYWQWVRRGLKSFAATEPLFRLGDPKTHLYVVESGVVTVYEPRLEGHQAIIEFAFPGDIVGLGFLQTHICTARASVETVAHCVPFGAQDRLVADDPKAQARLADAIEREFEFLRGSSIKFSRENPLGRVAAFLLTLSRENEQEGRDPTVLVQPLHCGVVADFLALSIDRLGSLLVELERRGVIEPSPPNGLRLIDVVGLEGLAGPRLSYSKRSFESEEKIAHTDQEVSAR
jgi:CRP/FNR family transcriptional regulator, anaerobic regulatory protein